MRHHALSTAAIAVIALLALPSRAHGPAPAALDVLAYDGAAPTVVRTNIGLARALGDGTYEYVCPSRWDENPLALSVASPDGSEVLVHSAGVAFHSSDGGCTFAAVTGADLYVTGAVAVEDGFVLLAEDAPSDLDPSSSHLLRVAAGRVSTEAVALPGAVDGLLATSAGWIASGHAPTGFVTDQAGSTVTFETEATRLTPRAAGAREVWLRGTADGDVFLVRVSEGQAWPSADDLTTVQGPVRVGERWLALLDGALHAYDDDEWERIGEVEWTCLRAHGDRPFACALDSLLTLEDARPTPHEAAVFAMQQIGPPAACGSDEAQAVCEREWLHYAGEAGWTETLPATSPDAARRPAPSGCAVSPGRATSWFLWPLLVAGGLLGRRGWRGRRRRRL